MAIGIFVTEFAVADTTERVETETGFKIIIKDDNGNVIRIKNWTSHMGQSGVDYPSLDNETIIRYTRATNDDGTTIYRKWNEKKIEYYNDRSGKVAKETVNLYERNEKLGGRTIYYYDKDHHRLSSSTEFWEYDSHDRVKTHEHLVDGKRKSGEIYYYKGKNESPYFISTAEWDNLKGRWVERADSHERRLKREEEIKSAEADKTPQGDKKVEGKDEHEQAPKTGEKLKSADADKKPQGDKKVGEADKSKMRDTDKGAPRKEVRSRDRDSSSIFKTGRTSRGRH